jgi:DNA-binding transcriptional MerR regulator
MGRASVQQLKKPTDEQLHIGELAATLGLNPKTIRYYEDIGLLPAPQRTPAGYRLYDAGDRERLTFILKARAIGLTLDEIGDVLDLRRGGQRPCVHVVRVIDDKIAGIDQQLRALKEVRAELVEVRREAGDVAAGDGAVCGIIEHIEMDRVQQSAVTATGARRPFSRTNEKQPIRNMAKT